MLKDELVIIAAYCAGAFITFGALVTKWSGVAMFFAIGWPAYWLSYLGYWLAN